MTNLTRRNFILGSLGVASLFTVGSLSGCSGSVAWYQLDKFISQDPSAIVSELEENQGFEYVLEAGELGEEDDRYEWQGIPEDEIIEDTQYSLYFLGTDNEVLSKDALLNGEQIEGARVHFVCDAYDTKSAQSTTSNIIEKCGFSNVEVEGDDGASYLAAGRCSINGQDAYWLIMLWTEIDMGRIEVHLDNDGTLEWAKEEFG